MDVKEFYTLNKYCFNCFGIYYKDIKIYQKYHKLSLFKLKKCFEIKSRDYLYDLFYKVDLNPDDKETINLIHKYINKMNLF